MIESIVTSALPILLKEAITPILKATISSALKGIKSITPEVMDLFTYRFSEYIECQVERHKCLNTLVFNQQILLDEIYIPLTLQSEITVENRVKEIGFKISHFDMNFLPKFNRVLITDTAGMGKSTLLRYLFLECVKSEYAIPIFLELRTLSKSQTILDAIYSQLNLTSKQNLEEPKLTLPVKYIEKIIKSGDFIFFLDGYDEIPFREREFVTASINEFVSKNSKNIFVISSRPESGLLSFPSFHKFNIRPLVKEESYALIKKYDKQDIKSQQLIEKLENKEYKGVDEYLKNPLLTTLLYRCYEYKQNLPLKKHVFYRQVFDALYDWHDATKDGYNTREKKCKLDLDSFHRVLRVVGFISVMQGKVEADTDLILQWIREAKRICSNLSFSESDFLEDCVKAVPVIIKDGSFFRWSHKSLSEYFAAQFLCTEGKDQQSKILDSISNSSSIEKFTNMLDQIYDIEPTAFKKHFILPLVSEFKMFWESSYKNLNPKIPSEIVALRKCATFDKNFFLGKNFLPKLGLTNIFDDLSTEFKGKTRKKIRSISIMQTKDRKAIQCIEAAGNYSQIINILADKKDPLVRSKHKIDLGSIKSNVTHIPSKGFLLVDDSELSKLNTLSNFAAVTKLIMNHNSILDHEKILNYSMEDEDAKLAELAEALLSNLTNASSTQ